MLFGSYPVRFAQAGFWLGLASPFLWFATQLANAEIEAPAYSLFAPAIPIFDTAHTPVDAKVLGPITATACKTGLLQELPREEAVKAQLLEKVRAHGGNAIGNLRCANEPSSATCLSSIVCKGMVLKLIPRSDSTGSIRR